MLDIEMNAERLLAVGELVLDAGDGRRLDKRDHGRAAEYRRAPAAEPRRGMLLGDDQRSAAEPSRLQTAAVVIR